jgi:hypothetical protein
MALSGFGLLAHQVLIAARVGISTSWHSPIYNQSAKPPPIHTWVSLQFEGQKTKTKGVLEVFGINGGMELTGDN